MTAIDVLWNEYCEAHKLRRPRCAEEMDEYIKLRNEFVLWELHKDCFWTDFQNYLKIYKHTTEYLPCDCAERQCNMACAYFGGKCARETESLKNPLL